ncbi:6,7-dimethyl-8-ribityllumazine synthase [Brucella anthropi]|uniref:6,7-dimethyl-8-ribityllumazine synthase n=1 Tax=Brucella anthropi TaxID=529 RepID=A0A6I0DFY0_BRUAN|nr:6,7-dimethyl-8-ribityllumazine synthase [Brucella anthropi]KAB2790325.1 6,7-dimethyl-8-ribityllumazine synthase [Brucella anthropi]
MKRQIRIAYIKARWHADLVDKSFAGYLDEMTALGLDHRTDTVEVPGAFELPLMAKAVASSGRYDAVIAAALVVDGGIYRHDFVAQAVVSGLMQAGLDTGVPILSVSLTPHNFNGGAEHRAFFSDHFVIKGAEAARAILGILAARERTLSFDGTCGVCGKGRGVDLRATA